MVYRHAIMTPAQYADDLFLGLARTLTSQNALPEHATTGQSVRDLADSLRNDPAMAYNLAIKPVFHKNE